MAGDNDDRNIKLADWESISKTFTKMLNDVLEYRDKQNEREHDRLEKRVDRNNQNIIMLLVICGIAVLWSIIAPFVTK